ncbi:MAG: hypothetical protein HYY24_03435 [Verrucomicrobia bacterium]|nr:hypothetical protein [Verrucomicrobiota bacterium]
MKGKLDQQTMLRALERLADLLRERGLLGEICLLGGAVMVLAFKARVATRDVDAIFHPAQVIRELAAVVESEMDLPEHWLNDGAKGFVSARHQAQAGDLPQFENLRLTAPTAEYMLAMKCIAARVAEGSDEPGDLPDIEFLVRRLGLKSPDEVLAVVAQFYPDSRVPARTRFVVEDIFASIKKAP